MVVVGSAWELDCEDVVVVVFSLLVSSSVLNARGRTKKLFGLYGFSWYLYEVVGFVRTLLARGRRSMMLGIARMCWLSLGRFDLVAAAAVGVAVAVVVVVRVEVMAAETDRSNVVRGLEWNPIHMCSLMPWKQRYMPLRRFAHDRCCRCSNMG